MYRLTHLTKLLSDAKIAGRSAAKTYQQKYELCQTHKLLQEPEELPTDVLRLIVQKSVDNCDEDPSDTYNVLSSLSRVNKEVRSLVEPRWMETMDSMLFMNTAEKVTAMEQVRKGAINIKRAMYLITQKGCEFCECKRIRKVYWEFGGGVRCCTECLHARTMSDYRLENELGVSKEILDRLPHTTAHMYAPRAGYYTLRFYWTKAVLKEIGASSVEYAKEICDARKKAAELEKEERRKAKEEENAILFFEAVKEAITANDRKMKRASEFAPKAFLSPEALCKASRVFKYEVKSSSTSIDFFKQCTIYRIAEDVVEKIVSANMSRWYRKSKIMAKLDRCFDKDAVRDKGIEAAVGVVFNNEAVPVINKAWFVEHAEKLISKRIEERRREQERAEQQRLVRIEQNRKFKCPLCPFVFDRNFCDIGLRDHIRVKHPNVSVS